MSRPDESDAIELRSLAEQLARSAGELALAGRRSLPVGQPPAHDTKSSATDPVTEFDRAAEDQIVEALRRDRPDDAIVGEEGAADPGTSGLEWHIDPIDGTANFLYDLPSWSTSVAVVDANGPLAGAVYAPVTDELFSASRGCGATLNGVPTSASSAASLELAMVATGFSYLTEHRAAQARRIARLLPRVRDIRRMGSAALDLCFVACGRLDAYFEEPLNSWDVAAGLLIASESGAITSDFHDTVSGGGGALASAPGVHEQLVSAIREATN